MPEDGKFDVLVNVIEVPDPPVPAVSSSKAPFKVVVVAPVSSPPQEPKPQPNPANCSAGPTG